MPTIRVAIAGATGYAGEELVRLLLNHPHVELTYLAASAKWERPAPIGEVFPRFARQLTLPIEAFDPERAASRSDVVMLALPHGAAMAAAPQLLAAGKRVIDFSGDFRLLDASLYPRWYKFEHAHPALLRDPALAYGLPEYRGAEIRAARLVANPGCYATSILLGCLPLFKAGLVQEQRIIVDAKSGLTGAGRKADASLLFAEISENLRAYRVNEHQHMPEVVQEIARLSGRQALMAFTPQVIPVARGLSSTIYVRTAAPREAIVRAFEEAYAPAAAPFVRVRVGVLPQLRDVAGTNYCDVGLVHDAGLQLLTVMSSLDNLVKGAAGQAVQNFNLMCGFPETAGLQ